MPASNKPVRQEIERVLSRLKAEDITSCLGILQSVFASGKSYNNPGGMLALLKDASASNALKAVGTFIFRSWRVWCGPSLAESVAALKDLAWLRGRLKALALAQPDGMAVARELASESTGMLTSVEHDVFRERLVQACELCAGTTSKAKETDIGNSSINGGLEFATLIISTLGAGKDGCIRTVPLFPELSDGRLIQLMYESILERGCTAREISDWQRKLDGGLVGRWDVLHGICSAAVNASQPVHNPNSFHVMGTGQFVTIDDWTRKMQDVRTGCGGTHPEPVFHSRFHIKRGPGFLVTAIASLYQGGAFIEQFMDNITSQTCFRDCCELVIIDANSPERESEVIERYCKHHNNIVYRRMNDRIGIYDAWNAGIRIARGEYLTNTNVDDLRRRDSLELQAAALDNLPFVDVVYQDFFYTFDPHREIEEIARAGYKSRLPLVTPYTLMNFNPPHNAPMWRKRLHEELGYFDESYRSAGDYEFWMRCLAAKKVFYKINDPHVIYYQNPEGMSTRQDTSGFSEARLIHKTYGRTLVSENVVMSIDQFENKLPPDSDAPANSMCSRYTRVQHALRDAAIGKKYARPADGGAPV